MSGAGVAAIKSVPALSPSALFSPTEQSSQVFTQKTGLPRNAHKAGCLRKRLVPKARSLLQKQAENPSSECVAGKFGPGRRQKSHGKSRRHTMQASTIIAPEVEVPEGQDYVRRGGPDADLVAKQAGKKLDQPKLADTVGSLFCTAVVMTWLSHSSVSSDFTGARRGFDHRTWSLVFSDQVQASMTVPSPNFLHSQSTSLLAAFSY